MRKIVILLLIITLSSLLVYLFSEQVVSVAFSKSVEYEISPYQSKISAFQMEKGDTIDFTLSTGEYSIYLEIIQTAPSAYVGGEFPVIKSRERTVWGPKNVTGSLSLEVTADRWGIYIFILVNPTDNPVSVSASYNIKKLDIPETRIRTFSLITLLISFFSLVLVYFEPYQKS
jgi:hypothetical protein